MIRRLAGWLLNLIALDGEPWRCARGRHYPAMRRNGRGRYEYVDCTNRRCHLYKPTDLERGRMEGRIP